MVRRSAGLLMFRRRGAEIEVLLVHPGGPFWRKKDLGAWSIPKGEYEEGEDAQAAARREFQEETGIAVTGELTPLGEIRQAGGKLVSACPSGKVTDVATELSVRDFLGIVQLYQSDANGVCL